MSLPVARVAALPALGWLAGRGGPRERLRAMALASLAVPVYLAIYVGFRLLHPSQYAGNALDFAHPLRVLTAMAAYSQSALPWGRFPSTSNT